MSDLSIIDSDSDSESGSEEVPIRSDANYYIIEGRVVVFFPGSGIRFEMDPSQAREMAKWLIVSADEADRIMGESN